MLFRSFIGKNITGAVTAQAVRVSGQIIQSDVTSEARAFISLVGTANASFTCGNLEHFYAGQGTFGTGSTVTDQYGFMAASSLTGATNNYGFYSNIASGTGRWNFYAAGTADNYFAGNVGIGQDPSNWYGNPARFVATNNQNASSIFGFGNSTVGANAAINFRLIGGTGNSYADQKLIDANGAPYYVHDFGSAVLRYQMMFGGSTRMQIEIGRAHV